MGQVTAGWILLIVGVLFLLVGLVGAARKIVISHVQLNQGINPSSFSVPIGTIIKALLKAGPWGVCTAVGIALVLVGAAMIGFKLPDLK